MADARTPKYPLNPLLEHRARAADAATDELRGAVHARETAEVAHRQTEAARRDAEDRADAVRSVEADRLDRGELRAVDLARQGAWEVGARAEIASLEDAEARAAQKLAADRRDEADARATLATRKAEHDVVVKDRAKFVAQANKRADEAAEEAAEENWNGGRRR